MKIWAVVPVKQLHNTKTRLSSRLSQPERAELTLTLLKNLLEQLGQVPLIEQIVVVSRDPLVIEIGQMMGVLVTEEGEGGDLNTAVSQAAHFAKVHGATHIMAVPTDLPFVTKDDFTWFLKLAVENTVLICSDAESLGTNALFVPLNVDYQFFYGINSFNQHIIEAGKKSLKVTVFTNVHIQFDVDTEKDWHAYQQIQMKRELLHDGQR